VIELRVVDGMLAEYWANADSLLSCSSLASEKSPAPAAKARFHAATRKEIPMKFLFTDDAFSFEALRVRRSGPRQTGLSHSAPAHAPN
jgi:hypothetical protein